MMHETITAAPAMETPSSAANYYDGGRRVMQNGVPCKVFSRPRSKETREVIDRMTRAIAGECDWTPHPDLPGFTFTPAEQANATTKAPRASAGSAVSTKYDRAYYANGHRIVINGVPCRVATKPTKNCMAMLRENKSFAPVSNEIGPGHPDYWHDTDSNARFSAKRCEARYAEAMAEMRAAMVEAAPVEAPAVQMDLVDAPAPAPAVDIAERPRIRVRLVQGEAVNACPPVVEKVEAVEAPANELKAFAAPVMANDTLASTEGSDMPTDTAERSTATPAPDNAEPGPLPADPRARAVVVSRDTRAVGMSNAKHAKRLRMVRRYLAMRAERQAMRERLAAMQKALDQSVAIIALAEDRAQAKVVQARRETATWKARAIEAGYVELKGTAAIFALYREHQANRAGMAMSGSAR